MFAGIGGKPGSRVFLEERQQFRGPDEFGVGVRPRCDDPQDVFRSQDGQRMRQGSTGDGGEKQVTSGLNASNEQGQNR